MDGHDQVGQNRGSAVISASCLSSKSGPQVRLGGILGHNTTMAGMSLEPITSAGDTGG